MTVITVKKAEDVAKQFFWLAWKAARSPSGSGWLQNFPEATIENVWENVCTAGDYPGKRLQKDGHLYADYVFGRMLKVGLILNTEQNSVEINDCQASPDYQDWSDVFPTVKALLEAAINKA